MTQTRYDINGSQDRFIEAYGDLHPYAAAGYRRLSQRFYWLLEDANDAAERMGDLSEAITVAQPSLGQQSDIYDDLMARYYRLQDRRDGAHLQADRIARLMLEAVGEVQDAATAAGEELD